VSAVRILLVDDQALVRGGFRMILEGEPDLEVVGEAEDGQQAVALATRRRPDIVLMDLRMPRVDGLEATRRLQALPEPPHVLVVTTFGDDDHLLEALRAGAGGFLVKNAAPEELVEAVRTVARGDGLLTPAMARRVMQELARGPAPPDDRDVLGELTEREAEVLRLVARGLTNREIAEQLVIAPATAKSHVASILAKFGLRDRVQAVVLAYEAGLVRPGEA
jgi:DNA-binding NarL/FixJ family response regulator